MSDEGGHCMVRSDSSWVMVTWDPPPTEWLTDRHNWIYYLPCKISLSKDTLVVILEYLPCIVENLCEVSPSYAASEAEAKRREEEARRRVEQERKRQVRMHKSIWKNKLHSKPAKARKKVLMIVNRTWPCLIETDLSEFCVWKHEDKRNSISQSCGR